RGHETVLVHEPDAVVGGDLPYPGVGGDRHAQFTRHLEGCLLREVRAGRRDVEGHLEAEHVVAAAEVPADKAAKLGGGRPLPGGCLDVAVAQDEPPGHLLERGQRSLGVIHRLQVVRPVHRGGHAGVDRLDRRQEVACVDVLGPERLAPLQVVPDEVLGERPVGAVPAHRRLPHVPVGVDHAGHEDAAGRVDLGRALGYLEAGAADGADPVAGDQNVGAMQDVMGVVHRQHGRVAEHDRPSWRQVGGGRAGSWLTTHLLWAGCGCHELPPLCCSPQCCKTPVLPEPSVLLEPCGARACAPAVTDMCPHNGQTQPDRNIGRPGGRCQVTIRPAGGSGKLAMSPMRPRRPRRATVVKARGRRATGYPADPAPASTAQPPQYTECRSGEAPMARRDSSPDFIEALARGLDVIRAFQPGQPAMSLAKVAGAAGLARPTARRNLLTLGQIGCVGAVEPLEQMRDVRAVDRKYELTPRVLELGMSYVLSRNLWEVARPHIERLVARTHESSSIARLDGSDIVYVARVAVPKIVALAVTIGTRFPAMQTSLGKVLLAALPPEEAERVLAEPSRSGITPRI